MGTRVIASESYWRQPLKWSRAAEKEGVRRRVFCASLADVFEDRPELVAPRRRLWDLIEVTPHLDWLLLTKRPENICRMLGPDGIKVYAIEGVVPCPQPNVWLGVSCEGQEQTKRIDELLRAPAVVRFVSAEPLLSRLDLSPWLVGEPRLDWVIGGGESGPNARPSRIEDHRFLMQQCRHAGVAYFEKQLGANVQCANDNVSDWLDECHLSSDDVYDYAGQGCQGDLDRVHLCDRKGGDIDEFPSDLRVREFPEGLRNQQHARTSAVTNAGSTGL